MPEAPPPPDNAIADFIRRWQASGAAERANYALFLTQLCDILAVPEPNPTTDDPEQNTYVFECDVTFDQGDGTTTSGRIDLYKRASFVLEAKQGSDAQAADDEEALLSEPGGRGSRRAASSNDEPLSSATAGSPSSARQRKKKGTAVRGTKAWDDAMVRARGQAVRYAQALPASEGWPPFLIVVDVGLL